MEAVKLAADLFRAKVAEKKAKAKVLEAEQALVALLGTKENGSKTENLDGFKVVIKTGTNITADIDGMRTAGAVFWPVAKKEYFDKKLWANILADHPDDARKLRKHITSKPAKTSVTITKVA